MGTGPRARPGCSDHRPPPRARRPRLAARLTSRLGCSSLFAAPQRWQMRPRRARSPCGSTAAVAPGASSLPPPSRALTQHAAAAAATASFHPPSEEGGGARRRGGGGGSGRPGLEGRTTAPPAARGPAWEPRSGRRPRRRSYRREARGPAPTPRGRALGANGAIREEGSGSGAQGPGRG